MKKLTIIVLFILTAFGSKAQSDEGLHFGLKITPSIAWLRTDSKEVETNGTKFGFCYGLITEFNFAEHYAFATGLDVTYRGGNLKSSFTVNDGTTSTVTVTESSSTLQYIEIPISLKLKTNEIGSLTYFLQAGVAPGFNIRARADIKSNSETTTLATGDKVNGPTFEANDEDIQENTNNLNFSMLIGGGIEYTLSGSTVLLVGLQFNNGLLDISDEEDIKANSNLLGLSIGILF
ncbi:MAG: PorT family protein [Bacteroidia bacterium]|nr:PorT family protein [Bacteroidota bacterium]MBK7431676.1 PorT family protein [Bacteroidota bacterium]MBP9791319.1 PorT family protein [Bacteroidia bacterium]MBP9924006.1 PorT family protein [Bacteroidia bacterium]